MWLSGSIVIAFFIKDYAETFKHVSVNSIKPFFIFFLECSNDE